MHTLNYLFAGGIVFSHIFGYVFSGLSVFFIYKNWQNLKKEKIFLAIAAFLVYGFILSCFAQDKQKAFDEMFNYFASWMLPFVLGYYIVEEIKKYKIIMTNVAIFSVIVCLSILSYYGLFYEQIFGSFFSFKGVVLKAFLWHISLGAMCVAISCSSLVFLLFKQDLNSKTRLILITFIFLFIGSLFLTGSRGYYIAGFITYMSIFAFYFYKTRKIKIPVIIILSSIIIVSVIYLTNPYMQQRIKNTSIKHENSLTTRTTLYKTSLIIFKKHPVFGVGPRQSTIQKEYVENTKDNAGNAVHMHSIYFNMLSDFGLAGMILFVLLIYFIFKRLVYCYKRENSLLALALVFCWISVLVGDCFDTVLRGPRVAMEYFWITGLVLGGTLINVNKKEIENEKKQ